MDGSVFRAGAHWAHSAVPFFGRNSPCMSVFSISSSLILRSSPPAYPVRLPFVPTTRWHGTMMLMGLCPTAPPTACADMRTVCRRLPVWNFEQQLPDRLSERRPDWMQRRREVGFASGEIDIQPALRVHQNGRFAFNVFFGQRFRVISSAIEPQPGQPHLIRRKQDVPQGRGYRLRVMHVCTVLWVFLKKQETL